MQTKVSKKDLMEYLETHPRKETYQHFGLGYTNFIAHLRYYGIENVGKKTRHGPKKPLPNKDAFLAYFKEHTLEECKAHFELGDWALKRTLDAYGLSFLKPYSEVKRPSRKVLREYLRTHSNRQAAECWDVSVGTIKKWKDICKIAKRPARTITCTEAAKILGVSKMRISVFIRQKVLSSVARNGNKCFLSIDEVNRLKESRLNCTKTIAQTNTEKTNVEEFA